MSAVPRPKKWMPLPGTIITSYLPNETVRATVMKKIASDCIEVVLNVQHPLAKSHNFRFNQKVMLYRAPMQPTGEKWETKEE